MYEDEDIELRHWYCDECEYDWLAPEDTDECPNCLGIEIDTID